MSPAAPVAGFSLTTTAPTTSAVVPAIAIPTHGAPAPGAPAGDPEALDRASRTLDQLESLAAQLEGPAGQPVEQPGRGAAASPSALVGGKESQWPADFRLSIVVPVFNEERTVRTILERVRALPIPKEIIVVDDHSTDGTREVLAELATWPELRVVYKAQNEGKGAALRTGFTAATGAIVVVQDADLEYDPRDIPSLLDPILAGEADVVYGSRFLAGAPHDPSWLHRVGNGLLTWASNLLTGLKLTDMETCYKAFRRDTIADLGLKQDRFGFEPEITARLARRGYRFAEAPIGYTPRSYQEGKKIGVKDLFNALYCIVRYGLAD